MVEVRNVVSCLLLLLQSLQFLQAVFIGVICLPIYYLGFTDAYETIMAHMMELGTAYVCNITTFHSRIHTFRYGDEIKLPKSENDKSLLICNHQSLIDVPTISTSLEDFGIHGQTSWLSWSRVLFAPLGQVAYLRGDCFFSTADWEKDRVVMEKCFKSFFKSKARNFYFIFPEGGLKNAKGIQKSQEYCAKNGKPLFSHVLFPRFKAFDLIMNHFRKSSSPAYLYDITVKYKGFEKEEPGLIEMYKRHWGSKCPEVHMHIERLRLREVIKCCKTESDLEEWLVEIWRRKEEKLAFFNANGAFPKSVGHTIPEIGRQVQTGSGKTLTMSLVLSLLFYLTCTTLYFVWEYLNLFIGMVVAEYPEMLNKIPLQPLFDLTGLKDNSEEL
eukprot:Nk52_evm1s1751 gene=Nk52_evmTU1s1751